MAKNTMKNSIKSRTFLIAGGNRTSLVWNCSKKNRLEISRKFLRAAEQVGFVNCNVNKMPSLTMMGNELCINAILALAYSLSGIGYLNTDGIKNPIQFTNKNGLTRITLPLKYIRFDNLILFEGIGFYCTTNEIKPKKNDLVVLAKKYNLPAFGYAVYTNNILKPYVLVLDVNSFTLETACGSGSIATTIATGIKKVMQLSGETILVQLSENAVTVTAKVTEVNACLNNKFLLP